MKEKEDFGLNYTYCPATELQKTLFIVIISYRCEIADIENYLPQHFAFLDRGYQAGYFLISGRQIPFIGGVIIAQASDQGLLEQFLQEDPFYQNNLVNVTITPFTPTRYLNTFDSVIGKALTPKLL